MKRTLLFGLAGFTALALLAWGVNVGLQYLARTESPDAPVAAALEGHVATTPQPVQSAPLRVLAGLNMPAVLFEMGYLTNATQEKSVTGDEGRTVLVQAIYDAVNRFALAPPGGRQP